MILEIVSCYLILMNLAGFVSMGRDKRRAVAGRRRTPERRLLTYAALGGSAGSIMGMLVFRHKTRHLKFSVGLPMILAIQAALVVAAILYL